MNIMSNLNLLFHDVMELLATMATIGSFVLVWRSRKYIDNNYIVMIGIAFFFVGVLEIAHAVANNITAALQNYSHNLHIQLWVAARYIENITLLIAPFLIGRRINFGRIFLVYTFVIILLFGTIFYWQIFPDCYVEASGLTNFELDSEYIVSQMLLLSVGLLFWKYTFFDKRVLTLLGIALVSAMASEVSFTQRVRDYIFPNIFGHIFLVVSYCLIYRAIDLARRIPTKSVT